MATLLLTAAATAVTASSPFWVTAAATVAATAVGAVIDRGIFSSTVHREGARLADLQVQSSNEGAPLPEVAGRMRLAGQVIWATRFREEATTETSGGGKGGGSGGGTSVTTYRYYANFAVALCEGPVDRLWRVWADGKPLDLSGLIWRFHTGNDDQAPDPLIEGIEGTGQIPAYRGTAYVVFENLPLERFGNRLPQLTFEVFRRVPPPEGAGLEDRIKAVTLIPGSGEFVYETRVITAGASEAAAGTLAPQNRSAGDSRADLFPALDDLAASLPNVARVFLVVGWFGDDLRAGQCRIRPRAEIAVKNSFEGRTPVGWRVHGQGREAVPIVSINPANGRIAYGGTPSDESVVRVIRELKRRGYAVTLYPFVFMDIPADNELPDPYSAGGAAIGQPAHPWRGRITAAIAPGFDGTTDGAAGIASEIATFVGTVTPGQIGAAIHGDDSVSISYSGANEWSYRRFILHYARLAQTVNAVDPGAVDAFVIGSELRGLSTLRDGVGSYPFVAHLRAMAADCRMVMGAGVRLTYAADWSEYFGHQPADGSGDLRYHLDPLWADANIDAVGIDNYLPLSDWRDGEDHVDRAAGWSGIYDAVYLRANIEGGEQYDWYYASVADRENQIRSPIADGAYGKPWVFRPKDLRAWWSNFHVERIAGMEQEAPTAWQPEGKPIWFTELGIPSIDRGTNQPNVFFDPKSSESALPHFSAGTRDDLVQRAGLEAWLEHYGPETATNPVSSVYGGSMVGDIAVWTWDARPFPAWPARDDLWGDTDLWPIGHWLNGKVACADLAGLVHGLCARVGLSGDMIDVSRLRGVVPGYLRDRPSTPRAEIEALMRSHDFDAAEIGGRLCFLPRGGEAAASLGPGDLVAGGEGEVDFALTRAQETDLPAEVAVSFTDVARDYRQSTVVSRRLVGGAAGRDSIALPLVMDEEQALATAERLLAEAWIGREGARFTLPPSALALDPGDIGALSIGA
ncbi:MAG: glycoside hydrolase/phage tail family protein, partial [Zavarzinia sp.]|nr:glycoside hydrolase/phage tail family protein [Zavarzinia sp.]